MSINIRPRTDYSALFSGLSSAKTPAGSMTNLLSEYASIKNGSYGKAAKAYYAKKAAEEAESSDKTKTKSGVSEERIAEIRSKIGEIDKAAGNTDTKAAAKSEKPISEMTSDELSEKIKTIQEDNANKLNKMYNDAGMSVSGQSNSIMDMFM